MLESLDQHEPQRGAGVRVLIEELAKAWRDREASVLLERSLVFQSKGLVLGAGVVLAPALRHGIGVSISLDGQEARLLALLAAAYGRAVDAGVLGHVRRAAARWEEGEVGLAAMHLALTGLGPLRPPREGARRLYLADGLLQLGVEPEVILRALGLDTAVTGLARLYNPNQPRVPKGSGRASGEWANVGRQLLSAGRKIAARLGQALVTEATVSALSRFAFYFPATTVFGAVLFIPPPNASNKWQDVPGRPGLRYRRLKYQPGWAIAYPLGSISGERALRFILAAGSKWIDHSSFEIGSPFYPPDPSLVTYPIFKGALLAMVSVWPAPWANASCWIWGERPPTQPGEAPFPLGYQMPWISYLSAERASELGPTPELITERTPDGGLLMSATETRFDPYNLDHMRRSRRMAEILIERGGNPSY